ncbi:hypothetical protein HMPREF1986_02723 [Oribacterium sp. oral taxon 078 str. F0263]|nr:hypothetical protein HMPREF1986_02723 [Oribacterium sp. oral taxon 078 str. F0263]
MLTRFNYIIIKLICKYLERNFIFSNFIPTFRPRIYFSVMKDGIRSYS